MTRARDLADFNFDGKAVTINESSADLDFRVESNGNANMLFVDASTDFVGIGHNSPSTALDISGAGVPLSINSSNSNTYKIQLEDAGTVRSYLGASSAAAFSVADSSAGELLQVDSSGNVGIGTSTIKHPLHIAYSETGSIPTDHQIGASSDNKNYIGIHNTSDSATYSGIALETRTTGASRWLIANERQDNFLGDLVFLTRDGGSSGSEVVRIQNNGNVGIGVTPTQKLHVSGNAIVTGIARLGDGSASSPAYQFVSDTNTGMFRVDSDKLAFSTGGTERFRVDDSGHLNYACTTISPGLGNTDTGIAIRADSIIAASSASGYVSINRNGDGTRIQFNNSGNTRGTITVTGTTTAYNTSSDRRLKSNIQDAASASAKIDAMKVRQFDWTEDGKHQDYGMIAQELQSIEPLAVSGSEDSNKMMGVDYSILVPMLIKEIQELRSRVAALEAS